MNLYRTTRYASALLLGLICVQSTAVMANCPIQLTADGADAQEQLRPPIDGCPDPGYPTPTPTPVKAPTTPASIAYPSYTNGKVVKVTWGTSNGYGTSVRYQLEQRVKNGAWAKVYDGTQRSASITRQNESVLTYRVRSCLSTNSTLCSGYRSGSKMIVNPLTATNLYTKYPVLHTVDARNAAYHASVQGFKTVVPRLAVPGKGTNVGVVSRLSTQAEEGERFYLGDGYDLLRGALKETCMDVQHPNFKITKTAPLQPSTFDVSLVNNNRHLATLLDVSVAATVGFNHDDFSLGFSAEKDRYVKSVTDDSHVRYVVKWVQRNEFWKLNTPTNAIIPELVSDVLNPGDGEAKADFRERCGDTFVSSANLGAAFYLVFSFDAKAYDYAERESKKGKLGLAITEIFKSSAAGSISTSTKQLFSELNVKVQAHQVGGPAGLAASVTIANVNTKYNSFIAGINASNRAAVDIATTNYQRPTVYNGYSHSDIFASYTGPLAQMRRWLDITVQHKERCDPWEEYNRIKPAQCGAAEAELSTALDNCRDTRDWASCQHPSQYYTGDLTTATPGSWLLGWLSTNVKKLNQDETTQYYNHHVHKGSKSIADKTCLRHSLCFANTFRGSGVGLGKGFSVHVTQYDNPKGSGPVYGLTSGNSCATTTARLETGGFLGDTTADFDYSIKFEGLCPDSEDYVIVP